MSYDRLTHVQLLFTWNPSQLSLQNLSLNTCYYHQDLHRTKFHTGFRHALNYKHSRPPTNYIHAIEIIDWYRPHGVAPSIFGASPFGRWVVTHSLAGFDFHDHRPAVKMDQHPLWYLISVQLSALSNR